MRVHWVSSNMALLIKKKRFKTISGPALFDRGTGYGPDCSSSNIRKKRGVQLLV